ncbi:MAG: MBL fold metallo-hydrolase [Pseudomonadota bacterium]|jgi:glyoxylase-like metal-dependent hydrolase (beta-lactamase superfamily II)|nr:MBL fold metallo-hydrolase [Pseudomonadota bacterium]
MYKLGDLEIHRAIESEVPIFDTFTFFPDATRDVVEANKDWLMPRYIDPKTIEIILCIQSYIIKTSHHTILVDTCVGNHKSRPARPSWHMQNAPFIEELANVGVHPEEVDFVLCTHLHVDHVGWNTKLVDGRWVPTFPNAKYIFSRNEYELWESRHENGEAVPVPLVYEDSVLPIVEAGQAIIVEDTHQIDDGMWLEPAPGHTPGHVMLNLKSREETALMSGDAIHHPIQLIRPEWSSRACEDPHMSAVSRTKMLERVADTNTLLCPAHFGSPTMGHVISHPNGGFRYRLINS